LSLARRRPEIEDAGMVEFEVYATGLRAPDKLMGLDLELGAIPGLRYKVDTLHDVIFLESGDPNLSLEEIRSIFNKLDLHARFVGQTHTVARSQSATQLIRP
jgi:hypothetical protein